MSEQASLLLFPALLVAASSASPLGDRHERPWQRSAIERVPFRRSAQCEGISAGAVRSIFDAPIPAQFLRQHVVGANGADQLEGQR